MHPADRLLAMLGLAAATAWAAGGLLVDLAVEVADRLRRRGLV